MVAKSIQLTDPSIEQLGAAWEEISTYPLDKDYLKNALDAAWKWPSGSLSTNKDAPIVIRISWDWENGFLNVQVTN